MRVVQGMAMAGVLQTMRGMAATQQEIATIDALYERMLGRDPDPGGMTYWAEKFDQGWTVEDVARSMANSAEYQDLHDGTPPVQTVQTVVPQTTVPVLPQTTNPVLTQNLVPSSISTTTAQDIYGGSVLNDPKTKMMLLGAAAIIAIIIMRKKSRKAR